MCIKVLGGSKRRIAGIGDIIKVSIKTHAARRVKKARFTALSWCVPPRRAPRDGSVINSTPMPRWLLNPKLEPIGTRIFGPVTRELRTERFMKIVSLAPEVL